MNLPCWMWTINWHQFGLFRPAFAVWAYHFSGKRIGPTTNIHRFINLLNWQIAPSSESRLVTTIGHHYSECLSNHQQKPSILHEPLLVTNLWSYWSTQVCRTLLRWPALVPWITLLEAYPTPRIPPTNHWGSPSLVAGAGGLIESCWAAEPKDRPSAEEVLRALQEVDTQGAGGPGVMRNCT